MRILVTGGEGFIGGHLRNHLASAGHEAHSIDRKRGGTYWLDLRDTTEQWREYVRAEFDFIYHLASTVGVRNVLGDPRETIENIIESTRAVLSVGVPGMYFSTSEVYGMYPTALRDVGLSENSLLVYSPKSRWSYAAAKLVCEWLALQAGWKVVRLFNVVGARQNMAYGAVMPTFVRQAMSGGPLTVFGDGAQVRTFMDVRDCVEILDQLREKDFDIVNVGGVNTLTINDLAEEVRYNTDPQVGIVHIPYEKAYPPNFEECPARIPDLGKLKSLIGQRSYRSLAETISEIKKETPWEANLQTTA